MSKYVAMMESQQVEWEMSAKESNSPQECRHCFATAADWRAMREAWEAMVVALDSSTAVLTQPNVGCYAQAAVNEAALAKARAT